jgi:GMP synthase-like glutamine amidotransferase
MKPIAIVRFAPHEGPGYFATYLSQHSLSWRLIRLDEGEDVPAVDSIAGVGLMGGPMSVNDELAWIAPVLDLVRESVTRDIPVIGHCLGGQLMAKALGGRVSSNAVKEIGWGRIDAADTRVAAEWGPRQPFLGYHWHGETFSVPAGAEPVWSSAHCANQAFALGNHFAMQCHVEMTEELIESWCRTGAREIEESLDRSPAVQTPDEMRDDMAARLDALHRVADRVYDRWTRALAK